MDMKNRKKIIAYIIVGFLIVLVVFSLYMLHVGFYKAVTHKDSSFIKQLPGNCMYKSTQYAFSHRSKGVELRTYEQKSNPGHALNVENKTIKDYSENTSWNNQPIKNYENYKKDGIKVVKKVYTAKFTKENIDTVYFDMGSTLSYSMWYYIQGYHLGLWYCSKINIFCKEIKK